MIIICFYIEHGLYGFNGLFFFVKFVFVYCPAERAERAEINPLASSISPAERAENAEGSSPAERKEIAEIFDVFIGAWSCRRE